VIFYALVSLGLIVVVLLGAVVSLFVGHRARPGAVGVTAPARRGGGSGTVAP